MSNTFGKNIRLTTFGSSHGEGLGGVIEGFPKGLQIDFDAINRDLARRKTANSRFSSQRKEPDIPQLLSGVESGCTTGFPIAFFIKNENARSQDYDSIINAFRPSHADFTYFKKYGDISLASLSRSSGRETASWVVAGSLASQWLAQRGVRITSYVSGIGNASEKKEYTELDLTQIHKNEIPTPRAETSARMLEELTSAHSRGDSLGGVATCIISGADSGLGEPIFDKLSARLAQAMLTIPSARGFDYGLGFRAASMSGAEFNDQFISDNGTVRPATNRNGGILGGISSGEDIYFRVAFKPVPSIRIEQATTDKAGNPQKIKVEGRHDACILPRVLPVLEAMAALTLMDFYLC